MLDVYFNESDFYDENDNQLFFDCDVKVSVNDTKDDCNYESAIEITDFDIESISDFNCEDVNGEEYIPEDLETFIKKELKSWFENHRYEINREGEYILV